jgi:hypothetical protein
VGGESGRREWEERVGGESGDRVCVILLVLCYDISGVCCY